VLVGNILESENCKTEGWNFLASRVFPWREPKRRCLTPLADDVLKQSILHTGKSKEKRSCHPGSVPYFSVKFCLLVEQKNATIKSFFLSYKYKK
jgi:hypothetical protein